MPGVATAIEPVAHGRDSSTVSRLHKPVQHGFKRDFSFDGGRLTAFKVDPALVEAVKHQDTRHRIGHTLQ